MRIPAFSSWASLAVALLLFSFVTIALAAQCPDNIDVDDCVSNDLQPTGTVIVNGPSACTLGETIALDLQIQFDNGGGANQRYSVGIFVGDNGQLPIGGSSCTFDSLRPVGGAIDLTGGAGGFLELNGDACGDVSTSDPTYKNIHLDKVLCQDNNGDGLVDIGYVLSWANNGNKEVCTDPLDPAQFLPAPPKCQAELEYDLPIVVELPPSIYVGKGANPSAIRAPGGLVKFVFTILNTSASPTDPVTITSIVDVPFGDLTNKTQCKLPVTLARGERISCVYTTEITGKKGEIFSDTMTVTGEDDEGNVVTGVDSAQVTIIGDAEPPQPGDLRLVKTAIPSLVYEPGGDVKYGVLIDDVSETGLIVTSLEDDIYGDLDGAGSCGLPIELAGDESLYTCSFVETVSGQPGDTIADTVTAEGMDLLPIRTALSAHDDATVTIINRRSDLEVTKVANPSVVIETGEDVTYKIYIQNASSADTIEVQQVTDTRAGDLTASCGAPITLAPGEFASCEFSDFVSGNAGGYVTNVVVAQGVDDDGQANLDQAAATVRIVGAPPSLEVTKLALPPLALEAGSNVTYLVVVQNTSGDLDPVTVTGLVDTVADDVGTVRDLAATCGLPTTLQPGERLVCKYTVAVNGSMTTPDNSDLVNTVTVTGVDDEGSVATGSDDAKVSFIAALPSAPALSLVKSAAPTSLPAPGGDVTYTVLVANSGDAGPVITITSLVDAPFGDLAGLGNCGALIGASLAAGESAECSYTIAVSGNDGDVIPDTVDGEATYSIGPVTNTLQASDSAEVEILRPSLGMNIVKTATPTTVREPGGDVTFAFTVTNTSPAETLSLTSVTDSVYGDLSGKGSCDFVRDLAAGEDYSCSFTATVGGDGGDQEVNTVVAVAQSAANIEVRATSQASVTILDTPSSISMTKRANPGVLPPGDGVVSFTFTVTNTGVDTVTVSSLIDSVYGNLDGQGDCSAPQVLAPGASYQCSIDAQVNGDESTPHLNVVTARGLDDGGVPVSASASALVRFMYSLREVPVAGQLAMALLALVMLLVGIYRTNRYPYTK